MEEGQKNHNVNIEHTTLEDMYFICDSVDVDIFLNDGQAYASFADFCKLKAIETKIERM